MSHAVIIDNGARVFKFPKVSWTNYRNEAKVLNALKGLDLGVSLQSLNYISADETYIVLNGITGEKITESSKEIGAKLGRFLKRLHSAKIDTEYGLWLEIELAMWRKRYEEASEYFKKNFSKAERKILDKLVFEYFPAKLIELGDDRVFSHHDLNVNNILICKNKIGIIDFEHAGLYDRATDFMCMPDGEMLNEMIKTYGADEKLKQKIKYRREMRTIIVARDHGLDPKRVREILNLYQSCE